MNTVASTSISVATAIVAVIALVLSYRSSQDNRDKIRLDLFNRRFTIYQRTLVFYQELIGWRDEQSQKNLIQPFIEASREALFIFPRDSGVYEHLQQFWKHATRIIQHKEMIALVSKAEMMLYEDEDAAATRTRLREERHESSLWLLTSMDRLEKLMQASMSFKRL
jgi:hypothetical protein